MKRTSTTSHTTFHLPSPNAVTFTFQARNVIDISIPSTSMWHTPSHWHHHHLSTHSIKVIHGKLVVASGFRETMGGATTYMNASSSIPYEPTLDERIRWEPRYEYCEKCRPIPQGLSVRLRADEGLRRNVCSVILDYKVYPQLSSTPLWLKLLFRCLALVPSTKEALLRRLLAVQVQLTLHGHDYYENHRYIPFSKMWLLPYPPRWLWHLEWRSMVWFSYVVGWCCYWEGRLLFGMSVVYPEYTPVAREQREKEELVSVG